MRELVFRRIHIAVKRTQISAALASPESGAAPTTTTSVPRSSDAQFNPCVVSLAPVVAASVRTFVGLLIAMLEMVATPAAATSDAHLTMVLAAIAPTIEQLKPFELRDERGALPATIADSCRAFLGWCERRLQRDDDASRGDVRGTLCLLQMMLRLSLATGSLSLLLRTARAIQSCAMVGVGASCTEAIAVMVHQYVQRAMAHDCVRSSVRALHVGARVEGRAPVPPSPTFSTLNGVFPTSGGSTNVWRPAVVLALHPDGSAVVRFDRSLTRSASATAAGAQHEVRLSRLNVRVAATKAAGRSAAPALFALKWQRGDSGTVGGAAAAAPSVSVQEEEWVKASLTQRVTEEECTAPPAVQATAALMSLLLARVFAQSSSTQRRQRSGTQTLHEEALFVELRGETFEILVHFLWTSMRSSVFDAASSSADAQPLRCTIAAAMMRLLSANLDALRAAGLTLESIGLPSANEDGGEEEMKPIARLRYLLLRIVAPEGVGDGGERNEMGLLRALGKGSFEAKKLRSCAAELLLSGFDFIVGSGAGRSEALNMIIHANACTPSGALDMLAKSPNLSARFGLAPVAVAVAIANDAVPLAIDFSALETLLKLVVEQHQHAKTETVVASGEELDSSELRILCRLVRSVVAAAAESTPVVDTAGLGRVWKDTAAPTLEGMASVVLKKLMVVLDDASARSSASVLVRGVVLPLLGAMAATWMHIPDDHTAPALRVSISWSAHWRAPSVALVDTIADIALKASQLPGELYSCLCSTAAHLLGKCIVQLVCIREPDDVSAASAVRASAATIGDDFKAAEVVDEQHIDEGFRDAMKGLLAPGGAVLRSLRLRAAPRRAIERRATQKGGQALERAENALALALIWHSGLLPELQQALQLTSELEACESESAPAASKMGGEEADEKVESDVKIESEEDRHPYMKPLGEAFVKAAATLRVWTTREAHSRGGTQEAHAKEAMERALLLLLVASEADELEHAKSGPRGAVITLLCEESGLLLGESLRHPPASSAEAVVRFVRSSRITSLEWRRRLRGRRQRADLRARALKLAANAVRGLPVDVAISHVLIPLAVTTHRVTATAALVAASMDSTMSAAAAVAPASFSKMMKLPFTVCRFSDTLEPLPAQLNSALRESFADLVGGSIVWGGFGRDAASKQDQDERQRAQLTATLLWSVALSPKEARLVDMLAPRLQDDLHRTRAAGRTTTDDPTLSLEWVASDDSGLISLGDDDASVEGSLVVESSHPFEPNMYQLQRIDVSVVDAGVVVVRFDARTSTGAMPSLASVQIFFDEACTIPATPPLSGGCGDAVWSRTVRVQRPQCFFRFQTGATNDGKCWGYRCSIRGERAANMGGSTQLPVSAAFAAPRVCTRLLLHTMRGVLTDSAWSRDALVNSDIAARIQSTLDLLLDELKAAVDTAVQSVERIKYCAPSAQYAANIGAECHVWLRFLESVWPRIPVAIRTRSAPRVWLSLLHIAATLPPLVGRHAIRTLSIIMPGVSEECVVPNEALAKLIRVAVKYSPLSSSTSELSDTVRPRTNGVSDAASGGSSGSDDESKRVCNRSFMCDDMFAKSHLALDAVQLLQQLLNSASGALCRFVVEYVKREFSALRECDGEFAATAGVDQLRHGAVALRILAGLSPTGLAALALDSDDVLLLVRLATAGSDSMLDRVLIADRLQRYERHLTAEGAAAISRRRTQLSSSKRGVTSSALSPLELSEAEAATEGSAAAAALLSIGMHVYDATVAGAKADLSTGSKTVETSSAAPALEVSKAQLRIAMDDSCELLFKQNVSKQLLSAQVIAESAAMLEIEHGVRSSARTLAASLNKARARAKRVARPASNGAVNVLEGKSCDAVRKVALVATLRVGAVAALASIAYSDKVGASLLWSTRDADGNCAVARALSFLVAQEARALDSAAIVAREGIERAAEKEGSGADVPSAHGNVGETRNVVVESKHNYADNADVCERVTIEGATELHVVFDSRCCTEKRYDYLEVFGDCTLSSRIGPRFEGNTFQHTDPAHPLTVVGDSLWYTFKSDASTNYWGYRFTVSATVVHSHTTSSAPSILHTFPLPRCGGDVVNALDATLWLQCRVAAVGTMDSGTTEAAAAAIPAPEEIVEEAATSTISTTLEDLATAVLIFSQDDADATLASQLEEDESIRERALDLARQVRDILLKKAHESEELRAREKELEALRGDDEREASAGAKKGPKLTPQKIAKAQRSSRKKKDKAAKVARRARSKAVQLASSSATSIASARDYLRATSANLLDLSAAALSHRQAQQLHTIAEQQHVSAGFSTGGFPSTIFKVGQVVIVPHFGRGVIADAPSGGDGGGGLVVGDILTVHLIDWTLTEGQVVVVHTPVECVVVLPHRAVVNHGAAAHWAMIPGRSEIGAPVEGLPQQPEQVLADEQLEQQQIARGLAFGLAFLAKRGSPTGAGASATSASGSASSTDPQPPPVLRWSQALGRDIALLDGDTVATRTQPGDYSSAGSGWGAHCSTPFSGATSSGEGPGQAVHEIILTIEEAGVSGRPGGLYIGVVDASWDWRTHSTSLYQVPDCYSYKANSRHREGIVYAHRAPRFRAPRFGTGDVVKMVVDFENTTIAFFLNNILVRRCDHIDHLPSSLRVVAAFANEQQRIRISRVGDDLQRFAAIGGDSSEANDEMSLFFTPTPPTSALISTRSGKDSAKKINAASFAASSRRSAVWTRWADVVDAAPVSHFVETGMDGDGRTPNRMPTRTPSGLLSPSSATSPHSSVALGHETSMPMQRAREQSLIVPSSSAGKDLGWDCATEVGAMSALVAALRCRGGAVCSAPTADRVEALYALSVENVWDWGRGPPTFAAMRVSPSIEVGPFAPGDALHSLIAPVVRLLAGRMAIPVAPWLDHTCEVRVHVPELGMTIACNISAAHLLPIADANEGSKEEVGSSKVNSTPLHCFERGRGELGAFHDDDTVARATLRLSHETCGAAASIAIATLAAMLRHPHHGAAPHPFTVAQIGGAAAIHCVIKQLLIGTGQITTARAIIDCVLHAQPAEAGAKVDAATALLRRALWSEALYGDSTIAVPSSIGFEIVALLEIDEKDDSHELRRTFAALSAALAQAPRRERPAAIEAMSGLLRHALDASDEDGTRTLGLGVSAKRLGEVRNKILECAHVGALDVTWRRPVLQNCVELIALLGRACSAQTLFEHTSASAGTVSPTTAAAMSVAVEEQSAAAVVDISRGVVVTAPIQHFELRRQASSAHPMDGWSADLNAVEQLFRTLAHASPSERGDVPEPVMSHAASIMNGSDGGTESGVLSLGVNKVSSTASRLASSSGSSRTRREGRSRSEGDRAGVAGSTGSGGSGGERESGSITGSAQRSVRWRVMPGTGCTAADAFEISREQCVGDYERAGGVTEMQRLCVLRGYGGFTIVGSVCFFRTQSSSELLSMLARGSEYASSTLYVCERNAELLALGVGANGQLLPPIDPLRNASVIALHACGGGSVVSSGNGSVVGGSAEGEVGVGGGAAATTPVVSSTGGMYIDPRRLRCSCRRGGDSVVASPPVDHETKIDDDAPFGLPRGVGRWYYEVTLGGSQMAQIGWLDLAAYPQSREGGGSTTLSSPPPPSPHPSMGAAQRVDPALILPGTPSPASGPGAIDGEGRTINQRYRNPTHAGHVAGAIAGARASATEVDAMRRSMRRTGDMVDRLEHPVENRILSSAAPFAALARGTPNRSESSRFSLLTAQQRQQQRATESHAARVQGTLSVFAHLSREGSGELTNEHSLAPRPLVSRFGSRERDRTEANPIPSTILVGDDMHSWGVDLTRGCIWHLAASRTSSAHTIRRPSARASAVTGIGNIAAGSVSVGSPLVGRSLHTPRVLEEGRGGGGGSRSPLFGSSVSGTMPGTSPPPWVPTRSGRNIDRHAYAAGCTWQRGDVLGCMVDLPNGTLEWTLNGESLSKAPSSIPCAAVRTAQALVPAASAWTGQSLTFNFGGPGRSFAYGPPPRYLPVYDGLYRSRSGGAAEVDIVAEAAAEVVNGAIGEALAAGVRACSGGVTENDTSPSSGGSRAARQLILPASSAAGETSKVTASEMTTSSLAPPSPPLLPLHAFSRAQDGEIVKLMNEAWQRSQGEFGPAGASAHWLVHTLSLPPRHVAHVGPESLLRSVSPADLRTRAAVLVVANMMIQRVFPVLNLTKHVSAAAAIVRCPELILLRVKQGLLARAFNDSSSVSGGSQRGAASSSQPNVKIRIDRLKAAAASGGDISVRGNTIFEQMSAELATVPAHRLRRAERAFRLEYEGERMVDEGGGYHEAISAACAELRAALPKRAGASGDDDAEALRRGRGAKARVSRSALPIMIRTPNARMHYGSLGIESSAGAMICEEGELLPMPPAEELSKPARRQQLRFLGQLLGIAVRSSSPIDVQLPLIAWKTVVLEARRVHSVLAASASVAPHLALRAWHSSQQLLLERRRQFDAPSRQEGGHGSNDGVPPGDARVRAVASALAKPLELLAEAQGQSPAALAAAAGLDTVLHSTVATLGAQLASVDLALATTLSALGEVREEESCAALDLHFVTTGWRGETVELVPHGARCDVTLANRQLYRELVLRFRAEQLHSALAPLCFGFAEIVRVLPWSFFSLFSVPLCNLPHLTIRPYPIPTLCYCFFCRSRHPFSLSTRRASFQFSRAESPMWTSLSSERRVSARKECTSMSHMCNSSSRCLSTTLAPRSALRGSALSPAAPAFRLPR